MQGFGIWADRQYLQCNMEKMDNFHIKSENKVTKMNTENITKRADQ